jgi:DNA-binding PadR family transcriptional regulator
VRSRDVDGKKVYEITDAGRAFLTEHKDVVEEIFDRVADAVERTVGGSMAEVNRALGQVVKNVYRVGWKAADDAARKRIADILARTAQEIDAVAT